MERRPRSSSSARFESAGGSGKSQLYLLDLTQSGATPTLFLQDQSIEISDRPDWSWVTGDVAFNFGPDIWVGVVDSRGRNFRSLGAQTARMNDPTWLPHGEALAVEIDAPIPGTAYPLPNTTKIDSSTGAIIKADLEGSALWGGAPSINPVHPNLIILPDSRLRRRRDTSPWRKSAQGYTPSIVYNSNHAK